MLAARLQRLDHRDGAVRRGSFLVRGQQQRDPAGVLRPVADEALGGDHERRDRGLHVGTAATVQPAVALLRLEGI